jgi:hypothetical protein
VTISASYTTPWDSIFGTLQDMLDARPYLVAEAAKMGVF